MGGNSDAGRMRKMLSMLVPLYLGLPYCERLQADRWLFVTIRCGFNTLIVISLIEATGAIIDQKEKDIGR